MNNIQNILRKLGFILTESSSGVHDIWTSSTNSSVWVALPKQWKPEDFEHYSRVITDVLIYQLNIENTPDNREEIVSQLSNLNYKLLNRVSLRSENYSESVPYELAQSITFKNITSFRTYFHQFSKQLKDIPVDKFQLNHTKKGSFIIPVSILYDGQLDTFDSFPNELNKMIRGYLDKIDLIKELNNEDARKFASDAFDASITSKVVEDIIGNKDSIASTVSKYKNIVEAIQISSKENPILDHYLSEEDKSFKNVDVSVLNPIPREFLESLVKLELKENDTLLEAHGVDMYVEVDSINIGGTAMFTVYGVGDEPVDNPFKAQTVELSKSRIDLCADALKTRAKIIIKGDITKEKKKVGHVVVDDISNDEANQIGTLFDGIASE